MFTHGTTGHDESIQTHDGRGQGPDKPLISVVMPAYNAQATIGAALSGLLTQTYSDVEVIVVDDGSTDSTGDICRAHGDLIQYHRQDNAGSSAARNVALSRASGDLLAFCDADDVLLPSYLETALQAYQSAGGGRRIVMNDALQLTANGLAHGRRLIRGHFPRRDQRLAILQKNFLPILSLFPKELYNEIGGFREDLMYCEDWEFWIRAVLAGWEVVYQPEPHALYRLTPNAKSSHAEVYAAEDDIVHLVRDEHWHCLREPEREFVELRLRTAAPRLLDIQAGEALTAKRWGDARQHYRQLATLSSEDPRVRVRAVLMSRLPGAMRLGRWRQAVIERRMGGRIEAPNPTSERPVAGKGS